MATATLSRKIRPAVQHPHLGSVNVRARDADFTLRVDAAAVNQPHARSEATIMLLSAAGSHTSIKSLRAVLIGGQNAKFSLPDCELGWRHERNRDGYLFYSHCLGPFAWHLLAIAKTEGLMPAYSEAALYRELRRTKYTTPILRHWIPWLAESLAANELLLPLKCFGCQAALLACPPDSLDAAVSEGLSQGFLRVKSC